MHTHTQPQMRRAAMILAAVAILSFALPRWSQASIAAPQITTPTPDSTKSGFSTVQISGTAPAGTTVEVFETLTSLGTAQAAANGTWALGHSFADGSHTVRATARDDTATSPSSETVTFTVDKVRPIVDITAPGPDHTFGPTGGVRIEGTASDNHDLSAIRLEYWQLGSAQTAQLADCTCDEDEALWSHEPVLGPGEWTVKAYAVDMANNSSLVDQVRFTNVGAGVPLDDAGLEGLLGDELPVPEILSPEEGETEPGAAEPVTFSGTTEPGSTVEISEEVEGLGTIGTAVDEDEDGHWSMKVRLPTGEYGIRATATDQNGNVSDPTDLLEFTVDGERPTVDVLTANNRIFLPTEPVVVEGTVEDNFDVASIVLEYYDAHGALVLRDVAECDNCPSSSANWRHEPGLPFGPGTYTLKVWAFDVAGNGAHKKTITIIKSL